MIMMTVEANAGGIKQEPPKFNIEVDLLKKHVEALVATPKPRNWRNLEILDWVSSYISSEFSSIGLTTHYQEFKARGNIYRNVVATLNSEHDEIIVIGAHYDVFGDLPGADDNASGVSGLIELARVLKKFETKIPFQIQFVAYANEEPPFFGSKEMGSYVHAESLYDKKANVNHMISIEMIGYFSDKKGSQEYPISLLKLFYPSEGNFIAVVSDYGSGKFRKALRNSINAFSNIKCRSLSAPSALVGVDFSDHRNYWEFGYKAVMVTDTSFYRNQNYHSEHDTIDTLDFERMKAVIAGMAYHFIR